MRRLTNSLILIAGLGLSQGALATAHIADFQSVSDPGGHGATFTITVDGIDVTVSAWSDTLNVQGDGDGDGTIETADLDRFTSQTRGVGWGIQNRDEGTGSPGHSADNIGSNQWVDFDMYLFEFTEDVTLTQADFSWLYVPDQSEISVAAISGTLASSLNGNTWANVVADAGLLWSDSTSVDSSTYEASISAGQTTSQYWLLGAYNSIFNTTFSGGSAANDGLKLQSIAFDKRTPPGTQIAEPHTALLMVLGGLALMLRRRRVS